MKIHDKFVIELAEVIKAYGNDTTIKDPLKIPCDYKFYEISGVAICEKSFKKMKRLDDEINAVLDKIRAEIQEKGFNSPLMNPVFTMTEIIDIIDKYKESEENI